MRAISIFFFSLCVMVTSIAQGSPNTSQVLSLYKSNEYGKATHKLLEILRSRQDIDVVSKLQFSIILIKNLKFYKQIYKNSVASQNKYLKNLINSSTDSESKYAPIFLAESEIHDRQIHAAKIRLKSLLKQSNISQEIKDRALLLMAKIELMENNIDSFNNIIKTLDQTNPLTKLSLIAMKLEFGESIDINIKSLLQHENLYTVNQQIISSRYAALTLLIHTLLGNLDHAINAHQQFVTDRASLIEQVNSDKTLRFYELMLPKALSNFYQELANQLLMVVKQDRKYHDTAIFYLSELELINGNKKNANEYKNTLKTLTRLPKKLSQLRHIRASAHGYLVGENNRAYHVWENAVKNLKNNPTLSADAILMCLYLNANCPTIAQRAQVSAERGQSQRYEKLSLNVGRYYLTHNHIAKARRMLENALNKSDSNNLSGNDPMLLLNLAEVYRLNNNYAESLQTLFALSQSFPIIRMLQDSVQGEYLFRQRGSAIPLVH